MGILWLNHYFCIHLTSAAKLFTSDSTESLNNLYKGFPNFKGYVSVDGKDWPISHTIFGNTKEKLTSKVSFALLNLISRISRVHLVGNTAVPCFSQVQNIKPWVDVHLKKSNPGGIYILNTFSNKIDGVPHYITFPADPMMVLNLRKDWNAFDDYLDAFTSKYRVRAKKVLKETDELEVTEYAGTDIDSDTLKLIAGLLKKTLAGKTLAMSSDLESVLKNYIDSFGDNYRIRVYSSNGKAKGFIGFVILDNCLMAMHLGFHTPEKQNMPIYQRMLYGLVFYGIEHKLITVNFGRTAIEIKSTLGAVPMENYFVALIRSPLICAFANMYKNMFYKPKTYTVRSPFKS